GLPISSNLAVMSIVASCECYLHLHIGMTAPCQARFATAENSTRRARSTGKTEAVKINENAGLQEILRRHRHLPPPRVAAREEGGNRRGTPPNMQAHHHRGRWTLGWKPGAKRFRRLAQASEGDIGGLPQARVGVERNARLEHSRIVRRFIARK